MPRRRRTFPGGLVYHALNRAVVDVQIGECALPFVHTNWDLVLNRFVPVVTRKQFLEFDDLMTAQDNVRLQII